MQITDTIAGFARRTPSKVAATDLIGSTRWSYAELDDDISRLAALLLSKGCKSGDRVAVLARNSVEQVILHFACSRAGLVFAPINWRLSPAEVASLIDVAQPVLIVTDPLCEELLPIKSAIVFLSSLVCESKSTEPLLDYETDINRPSLLLFTSGTTSLPKGVLLTEENLMVSGENFAAITSVTQSSCFLCEAPMFHTIGLVANIRPAFQQGGSIVVSDGFIPERTLKWLSSNTLAISHYIGVPQMIESFREQGEFDAKSLSRLTALVTGGAPHKQSDIQQWIDDQVMVVSGFGMSEVGTVFGMPTDLNIIRNKAGSVGIPGPFNKVRIVDENDKLCQPNQVGELQLRGKGVMREYFNNKEATEASKSKDGWFKSGDLVMQDEDGYFWIVDRKKDMFISGGENIYPAEIEAALVDYSGLKEFAVIGVPDDKWGEVGCVVAVPENVDDFSEDDILNFFTDKLAKYKIPKKVVVIDSLPRTSTGKLQKNRLKEFV